MANYINNLGQIRVGVRGWVAQETTTSNVTDVDATAFTTAASITDTTQISALNTLVNDLKTYGLWTKMKALYPFVGGSAASHKFNLKDPRDDNAAYRLVFSGGWTHSSTGALPNGTTGYADSKYNPYINGQLNSAHISYYSRTNSSSSNAIDMGALSAAPGNYHHMHIRYTGDLMFGLLNTSSAVSVSNNISQGLFISSRINNTNVSLYRNNSNIGNVSLNSSTQPSNNIYIGAGNITNSPQQYSSKESSFISIGDGLSDTEAANFNTSVQKFQTTLGRHVGTPYVSDTDAISFLMAAGITDGTQAAAINTLVIRMKADGVWTKMKAVYPFVGGTATSHKFNLKDPRDDNAAYRLVFSGGWIHSSNGAKPNGTTGYADTKLAPNVMAQNSIHASFYSRTDITGSYWDLGAYNAGGGVVIGPRYQSGTSLVYMNIKSADSMADNNPTIGLYMGNRTSSTSNTLFRNGVIIVNGNKSSFAPISLNIYLGADNEGTILGYSPREQAFASIGDGLTDEEATNLYSAVQAFQTSLGRQVNVPLVSDTDAQSFLNAANITSFQQASAVNKLVVDLKAAGVWSKMTAIYPFVGGSAASHKFNLKDPRDLNVAYRLVFNGGWTHTSTGAKPNGSNTYANTYFNPTVQSLSTTSQHLSYYSRTNIIENAIEIGAISSDNVNFLGLYVSSTSGTRAGLASSVRYNNSVVVDTRGLFIASRTDISNIKVHVNGSTQASQSVPSTGNDNFSIYIGAYGALTPDLFSSKESAFASIGDGLTDTESTSLYTAVQTYQTSLGRAVNTPVYNNGLVLNLDAGNANSYPGTGTTWFDLAAGNNGTLVNGPTYVTTNNGYINFDGINDNISFTSNCFNVPLYGTTNEFTINAWINWNAFPNNTHDEIVSWWASGTQTFSDGFLGLSSVSYLGFTNANPTLRFGDGWENTGVRFNSSTDLNKWWNITAVKTSTNAYIYVNSSLVATKGSSLSWGFNNVLNIGSQFTAGEYLNAKLSNIQIYNRALSATEILNNFNSTRGRFGL